MAFKIPFKRLTDEFRRLGGATVRLGQQVDRNFDEIEKQLNASGEGITSAEVSTTDATVTTIIRVKVPSTTTVTILSSVAARRTGGAAGTAEDGAGYLRYSVWKNVAGTATQIGSTTAVATNESQAGWDVTHAASGDEVLIQVTGAVNNNITWLANARVLRVSG